MEDAHGEESPGFSISVCQTQHNIRVTRFTTTSIKPAKKTNPHWITLSNLDRLFDNFYTPVILYYPYKAGRCVGEVAEKLKESLAEVLVAFYPLAGRVVENEHEVARLHCNDAGAVFSEAYVDGVLDDLKAQEGYHPAPELNGMVAAGLLSEDLTFSANGDGIPALVIQVTVFSCGGISVAMNWNHKVADGFSGFYFIKSWSNICRGNPISPLPVHDRSLIQPRHPPQVIVDIANTVRIDHPRPRPAQSAHDPQQIAVIHFEQGFVEKLRREATKNGRGPFTALDCLSAHLWRVLTRLRGLSGRQEVQFVACIDARRKLSPAPPPGLFSNACVVSYCAVTADDLLARPLSDVSDIIRGAIGEVGDETIRSTVDWVQLQGNAKLSLVLPHQLASGKALYTSSWAAFPMYELDFGWGIPGFAIRNSTNNPYLDGLVYFLPPPPNHGQLSALLHLPKSIITKLVANPSLLLSKFQGP
ncbi:hypothetical protein O6H91_15G033200 [Diphasiastrum complanatum]|uniref:Uncharacterized protein n=1 Tax=Diphasiastrum complanatum TaxID=34168 RepID=A0ACC2BH12_DIPCM|nr:hypothetical protein O6H91_Y486600 [Diphasiastrum complanatum]KAJ7529077.1 hypothetical protein O6H91_15G033200 [Diphasiastrum complanatum]